MRVLAAVLLACIVALPMAALAQKVTIDELTKPYDAKTRVEPAPPSSERDQLVVPVLVGILSVLIIGSAIYWFRRQSTQTPDRALDGGWRVRRRYARRVYDLAQPPPPDPGLSYQDYLQTDHWQERRTSALRRAGFSCQVCAGKGELHVHNRTYVRRGRELDSDLIVLCAGCHKLFHANGKLADAGRAID